MTLSATTLLNQSLTWWTLDTAAALLVGLVFALMHWDFDQMQRWAGERAAYRLRVEERVEPVSDEQMLEALRTAMAITCRAYGARLDTLIAARDYERDVTRAYDAVELALTPSAGLRVVR